MKWPAWPQYRHTPETSLFCLSGPVSRARPSCMGSVDVEEMDTESSVLARGGLALNVFSQVDADGKGN